MIEKLTPVEPMSPMENVLLDKVNEITSWINDVCALNVTNKQVTANLPNIDAGELTYLQKENSDLKDEVELLRKKLELTISTLDYVYRTNPISFHFEAIKKCFDQISNTDKGE